MESQGTLLSLLLLLVGVPLLVFGVLKLAGYDWNKPWLMWRTPAGPLPLWVYLAVIAVLAVGLLLANVAR